MSLGNRKDGDPSKQVKKAGRIARNHILAHMQNLASSGKILSDEMVVAGNDFKVTYGRDVKEIKNLAKKYA